MCAKDLSDQIEEANSQEEDKHLPEQPIAYLDLHNIHDLAKR
jgi:hypothetical protein